MHTSSGMTFAADPLISHREGVSNGKPMERSTERRIWGGRVWRRPFKKTGAKLHHAMVTRQVVSLRRLGGTRAGEMRYGRFLHNTKVSVNALVAGICAPTTARVAGRHVLAIEDTSEINYQSHAGRVRNLGSVGNGTDLGLFVHPLLAVDAEDGACLGLAHLHLWRRTEGASPKYRDLPIEAKESIRWIDTAQAGKKCLSLAANITVVADRECDIYEMWIRVPDERTDLLIRACRDRAADIDASGSLFECISRLPLAGTLRVPVPGRPGKRTAHEASLQVRFGEVTLKRPQHCSDKSAPERITVRAIEVIEEAATVVAGEEPIHWRLLTTHEIASWADAVRCIGYYRQRWHIEQTFRTLKSQGLDIESSLVESGERMEKLVCLALAASVKIMQLTLARDGTSERPATDVFNAEEIEVLHHVSPTMEGRTEKQKNPHPPQLLAWAAWVIARLGGWKGYASERKPGPITMHRGLQAFEGIFIGWKIAIGGREKDVCIR